MQDAGGPARHHQQGLQGLRVSDQYGPIPPQPPTYLSAAAKNNPYPYNPAKAKSLLSSATGGRSTPTGPRCVHQARDSSAPASAAPGFRRERRSRSTCSSPPGRTGSPPQTDAANDEVSSWAQAGIHINETTASFNTVIGNAVPAPPVPAARWDLEDWGGGWEFSPDYYPTGEEIFSTGAGSNSGDYSTATADSNIHGHQRHRPVNLTKYQNFLATDLPVIYLPAQVQSLTEIQNNLRGVTPQNIFSALTPEDWYFTK